MRPEEEECRVSLKVSAAFKKTDAEEVWGAKLQVWHMGKTGSILFVLLSKSTRGVLLMCFLP